MKKTLHIEDKDLAKAKAILKENGIAVTLTLPDNSGHQLRSTTGKQASIRPGKRKAGTSLADFGGIWADDERTLESIRQAAWPKRG